ncbi:uncharacterized protein LOC107265857 [Cephus cinctus]|uniref:Uncharacterized protein LOC107265857 n=1 Tax=Cephus cinctus TaxID=211228 RepID=A0AAJ7BPI5_CEPCN|nr:uncharacterized protein LOC107265857 [Cephus cinctus]
MPATPTTGEKRFIWDDAEGLVLLGVPKAEDEQTKSRKKQAQILHKTNVYCPHTYLMLNFHETLNPSEKIRFRRLYLRKVSPTEHNIIILQDVKDLVIYLISTPITIQFINFFHLPVVDRFLRALILYFQYYIEIWEDLARKREATVKKAPNPLARGSRAKYANEMDTLRCVLGREYAHLVVGCGECAPYHHMVTNKKSASTASSQSQGEKDLRIFEVLIRVAHRVVWITLQRKHYSLIEIEIHRLFRTDAYNSADRRTEGIFNKIMLEDEYIILHGPRMPEKRKLLKNSPLAYQLINTYCDYRIMGLGTVKLNTQDPRVIYLHNALLAKEESLTELGIKVGILGHPRSDYDIMLTPLEEEQPITAGNAEKDKWEKRRCSLAEKRQKILHQDRETVRMPQYLLYPEFTDIFPMEVDTKVCGEHQKEREDARKKWVSRELRRINNKYVETSSIATLPE